MKKVYNRGTMKWTSLVLTEQQQILQQIWRKQGKKTKPILDKQELETLDKKLQLVILQDIPVSITYFADGEYEVIEGKLRQVNGLEKYLQFNDLTKVQMEDVLDVEVAGQ